MKHTVSNVVSDGDGEVDLGDFFWRAEVLAHVACSVTGNGEKPALGPVC